MSELDRRAFLAASVGALSAFGSPTAAIASVSSAASFANARARLDRASGHNLAIFLQRTDTLSLTGLLGMRSVGGYPARGLFLLAFKLRASDADTAALLPARNGAPVATNAMTAGGLPPDEYACNYVLGLPRENFISFSLGRPFGNGAQNHPWQGNIELRGTTAGICWTSSNLNHPWFAGSRWIPDRGEGAHWRAYVIAELRRLASIELPEAVG